MGVLGGPDPADALRALGVEPAWRDGDVALGGAPWGQDRQGTMVVCGEVVLPGAERLRCQLAWPEASEADMLAELYGLHGPQALLHAPAMVAAAVWDKRKRRLVLLRDPVGCRTLYIAQRGATFWFAARLRSLRRCVAVSGDLSLTALRSYLTYSYVPGSETLWQGARELGPGVALVVEGGEAREVTVWEPRELPWRPEEGLEDHAGRLRDRVEEAVRDCLPPSGPVGVYLSGGLDSSLVTALAARNHGGPVHTYSLHFGPDYPNELPFAQMVADHWGTRHHVLAMEGRTIGDHLLETMAALDDPIGDPLTVPNLLMGRAARQDVGVILNGEGGDPCFGGPKNLPMLLFELYGPQTRRETAYLRAYRKCYDDLDVLLTPEVQAALATEPPQEELLSPYFSSKAMVHYLNRLMLINVRFKGADHILTKVNNITTACGLLAHSPLFARKVVEASFAIPPTYKLQGTKEKAVLKGAAQGLLPPLIVDRPKSGMRVPVQGWFRKDLRRLARGLLLSRRSRLRPYIRQEPLRQWLAYEGCLLPRHGQKIWMMVSLEAWLRGGVEG